LLREGLTASAASSLSTYVLKTLVVRNFADYFVYLKTSSGICWQVPNFISKGFGQHSQKASYFKTLFHITVQMLFLPTSIFFSVSRLVLLYMTATVGMRTILASPVPTGTQVGVTQGPEGIPIYLVLDYQGIDRRAYVGFGTNPETIVGLQYAGKVPPGRIQDHVVVQKPSFIDLKSGTSNVQLLKRVNRAAQFLDQFISRDQFI
ncbi:hypothetical protein F5880DRAFT_1512871, partial [Lentinula raphanica]